MSLRLRLQACAALHAPSAPASGAPRVRQGGYALVIVMIMVVLASLAATVAVSHAQVTVRREREADLLFIGDEFRRALQSYHAVTPPGGVPQYPKTLEELLEDKRFPNRVRHLRKIYVDPMTGKADWALEMQKDRIVGLHSVSDQEPLRKAGFPPIDAAFSDTKSYLQWRFLASDSAGTVTAGTSAAAGSDAPAGGGTGTGNPAAGIGKPAPVDLGTPPSGDVDPTLSSQCMLEFMFPRSGCTATPPPLGTDVNSCMRQYAALYNKCMAGD